MYYSFGRFTRDVVRGDNKQCLCFPLIRDWALPPAVSCNTVFMFSSCISCMSMFVIYSRLFVSHWITRAQQSGFIVHTQEMLWEHNPSVSMWKKHYLRYLSFSCLRPPTMPVLKLHSSLLPPSFWVAAALFHSKQLNVMFSPIFCKSPVSKRQKFNKSAVLVVLHLFCVRFKFNHQINTSQPSWCRRECCSTHQFICCALIQTLIRLA